MPDGRLNVTTVAAATPMDGAARFHLGVREISVQEDWREKLQHLAERRRDSWPLLVLVAGAASVALVTGGRSSAAQVAPPARPQVQASPATTPTAATSVVFVHVAGAVRQPGLYEFPAGARVADAVKSAGGATPRADLDALNLAEVLVDGTKVEVVRRGESAPPTSSAASASPASVAIPLNTADQLSLETIPGIGPVTATAILNHREEIGGFQSLEQLLDVDGIGPATFEAIRSYVTL